MSSVISLATEDDLKYTFYPVTSGSVQFKVRTAHDAHLALTSGPGESDPMYEVMIGGWGNTKSVIRKNRTKPDKVEVETPDILNAGEFRGFWVRWDGGSISAGREGEAVPFLSWEDNESVRISHVGVCTGWGSTGTWQIEDGAQFDTADKLEYRYYPIISGDLDFEYRGPHNCHIALTSGPEETEPMYEIIIGGWNNTKSVIRRGKQRSNKVETPTHGLVHPDESRRFIIQWRAGRLVVRSGTGNGPVIMEWVDPEPFIVTHFAVRTGWGARGLWQLPSLPGVSPKPTYSIPSAPGGAGVWVAGSGGTVPPNAFVGGEDGEPMYVARAHHEGALLPGKLIPSQGVAYVAWGGGEHGKPEYEVLCDSGARWVGTSGANIPTGAVPAGESEDGEPLFIGRVSHEGTVTVGKVHPSHGTCYISYAGQELGFTDFDVLVA